MTPPDETAWEPWSPDQLAAKLRGVREPWYIVGGWALDLWHGAQMRPHEDLEFATRPEHARKIAAQLSELTFFEANGGTLRATDPRQSISRATWQLWGADLKAGRWRVDMMLERGTPTHWIYKRNRQITQSRHDAIRTSADGTRFLSPALVLLFKAKQCRPKDQDDFDAALSKLYRSDRASLRGWLSICHPGHDWLGRLD